jgi:catechol-2,3-dioxygenase
MPPKLENIDHIHINVADRGAAETWYRDHLGFVRESSTDSLEAGKGPLTLVNFDGSIHLALFESTDIQNTVVAFKVSARDLVEWITHLSVQGIQVEPVDHKQSWSIYFRDPDGNPFEITTAEYKKFRRSNT